MLREKNTMSTLSKLNRIVLQALSPLPTTIQNPSLVISTTLGHKTALKQIHKYE